MKLQTLSTYYVPEGATRTVTFPNLRPGNEEGRVLLGNDRGTLFAPVYVEEADHNGLLLLKQYNAGSLIGTLQTLINHDLLDDGQPVEVTRYEGGGFDCEPVVEETVETMDDAM